MTNGPITGSQITAARALTETSQARLAARADVELSLLVEMEARRNLANEPGPDLSRIRKTLEDLGAVFLPEQHGSGVGVRLKFGRTQARAIDRWEDEGGAPADDEIP